MIDKERLEEIKKELELDWSDISYVVNQVDVKWLINRVEELEEENDELAERVHKLALDWSELVDERNRYKQALEYIQRAIYTQHCTMNHKWNTEFEKGQISGLIQASNIVDKAIRKVEGEV
jgi:septation ring formation regulator EzrA